MHSIAVAMFCYCMLLGVLIGLVYHLWLKGAPVRAAEKSRIFGLQQHEDVQKPDTEESTVTELLDTVRPFVAFSYCPKCNFGAVHPFSAVYRSRPKTIQLDPNDTTIVQLGPGKYGRRVSSTIVPIKPNFEKVLTGDVVRTCVEEDCGYRWVQR